MEYLTIIFSLIAIYGAVCFVKFMLSKNKSFDNIKEPMIIYASWLIMWLWNFNYNFYLEYASLVKHGGVQGDLYLAFRFILNVVPILAVCIIIMITVVVLLGKKIKKHILIGCSIYFFSLFLPNYITNFAYIVASWKWMPEGVVSFIHTGYNVLFWCYVIGFLAYGIYYKLKSKADENN